VFIKRDREVNVNGGLLLPLLIQNSPVEGALEKSGRRTDPVGRCFR